MNTLRLTLKQQLALYQIISSLIFIPYIIAESVIAQSPIVGKQAYNPFVSVALCIPIIVLLVGSFAYYVNQQIKASSVFYYQNLVIICICIAISISSLVTFITLKDTSGVVVSTLSTINSLIILYFGYRFNLEMLQVKPEETELLLDEVSKKQVRSSPKHFMLISLQLIKAILFLSGALISFFILLQAILCSIGLSQSKMPGKLVEIWSESDTNGFRQKISLHIFCDGPQNNKSTILYEVGAGGSSLDGTLLQKYVVSHGRRMCVYDRAGFGWSDFGIVPYADGDRTAIETFNLLTAAGEVTPFGFSVAGHSMGGEAAQAFAHRYPKLIRGLALLDAYPGNQNELTKHIHNNPESASERAKKYAEVRFCQFMSVFGYMRVNMTQEVRQQTEIFGKYKEVYYETQVSNKFIAANLIAQNNETFLSGLMTIHANEDKAKGLKIGENTCNNKCSVKWPTLQNRSVPVLVLATEDATEASCTDETPSCLLMKAHKAAYYEQAHLYSTTLSDNGHLIIAKGMFHMFTVTNAEYVGEQVLKYMNE